MEGSTFLIVVRTFIDEFTMKPHGILKVKNAVAGSVSYVTESKICSLGIFKFTVIFSTNFVTQFCPEMLIWSV